MLAIVLMIACPGSSRARPRRVDRWFRRLQFVSAAPTASDNGGNDVEKTMGNHRMLLLDPAFSRKRAAAFLGGARLSGRGWSGTLFGGWRIVKPWHADHQAQAVGGFCASASGAMTLFSAPASASGVHDPHITGSIIGVGSTQKLSAVRWGVAGNIIWGWIFTIPSLHRRVAWLLGTQYF